MPLQKKMVGRGLSLLDVIHRPSRKKVPEKFTLFLNYRSIRKITFFPSRPTFPVVGSLPRHKVQNTLNKGKSSLISKLRKKKILKIVSLNFYTHNDICVGEGVWPRPLPRPAGVPPPTPSVLRRSTHSSASGAGRGFLTNSAAKATQAAGESESVFGSRVRVSEPVSE